MSGKKLKIGIFGGSFDPVHKGHISLATDAKKYVGLDKVIFVPAKIQPFKQDKKPASSEARFEMLKIATNKINGMCISRFELDSDEISYTYLTMRNMHKQFGDKAKLYFITGADAFLKIDMWKEADELLANYSFIVGYRPGYNEIELQNHVSAIKEKYNTEIILIDNVQMNISSSGVRNLLYNDKTACNMLDERIERYIKYNGLYKS